MAELSGATFVHVDDHLLVADKPAGLLCVPGRGADKQDCLSARVQQHYPDALIVHRLDMATSGLCVLARGPMVQRQLSMAFAAREVHKRYVAVVHGKLASPDGDKWSVIDLPLSPDWPNRPLSKVDLDNGKPSLTRWRVLAHDDRQAADVVEVAVRDDDEVELDVAQQREVRQGPQAGGLRVQPAVHQDVEVADHQQE